MFTLYEVSVNEELIVESDEFTTTGESPSISLSADGDFGFIPKGFRNF